MRRNTSMLWLFMTCLLILVACGQKETADDLLSQAEAFEQEEKHQEALHSLEKLVAQYPESENVDKALHRAAFICYNNMNDFQKSIELHQKLIQKYPNSSFVPQARFMIGFIYANDLRDLENAEASYKDFLAHHPQHELGESVKWELEHLGQDVNEQLKDLFGEEGPTKSTMAN